jgi:hypothetical protein
VSCCQIECFYRILLVICFLPTRIPFSPQFIRKVSHRTRLLLQLRYRASALPVNTNNILRTTTFWRCKVSSRLDESMMSVELLVSSSVLLLKRPVCPNSSVRSIQYNKPSLSFQLFADHFRSTSLRIWATASHVKDRRPRRG